jgi:hypothetical protein
VKAHEDFATLAEKKACFRVQSAKSIPPGPDRLRKKGESQSTAARNVPQGLKPALYFQAFAARLKSCPFKATELFRSLFSPHGFFWLYAGVETPASLRIQFFRSL